MERLVRTFEGGHTEPVSSIAVSSDGNHLLSGSRRGEDGLKLWRVDNGAVLHKFPLDRDDSVSAVAFSPDGNFAVAATHFQNAVMWKMQTRDRIGAVASLDPSGGLGVAFPGDGGFILAAHGRRYTRYKLSLEVIQEHDNLQHGRIDSPSLSREGRFVASVHDPDGGPNIIVYDLLLDAPSLKLNGDPAALFNAVALDGNALLTGDIKGQLKMLDATTGNPIRNFDRPGHSKLVTSVTFSPNGRLALSGSQDFTAKVWEVSTGKEVISLNHGGGFVNCVAFLPNSLFALSGGNDETVKLWDLSGLLP
jgi:WD40 repeat protein